MAGRIPIGRAILIAVLPHRRDLLDRSSASMANQKHQRMVAREYDQPLQNSVMMTNPDAPSPPAAVNVPMAPLFDPPDPPPP